MAVFALYMTVNHFAVMIIKPHMLSANSYKSIACLHLYILSKKALFKLVDTRSVETSFLRGLQYANVSITHSLTS